MEKSLLYDLFVQAKDGSEVAKVDIYNKFLPCIKGFAKKLSYEEAETDLVIFLLEFINNVSLKKIKNISDGEIVLYVYNAIKCRYINILKALNNKNIQIIALDMDINHFDYYKEIELEYISWLLSNLSDVQKKIIIGKYLYNYSNIELSEICGISKQAVSRQRKKAIEIINLKLLIME